MKVQNKALKLLFSAATISQVRDGSMAEDLDPSVC